ncbi:MAG: hypothetical protein HY984_01005 [Candidatus Magasanikbacteria bacterium]|nr:hypothetical protein [Candidatus Magasanikbacteria bacterium]
MPAWFFLAYCGITALLLFYAWSATTRRAAGVLIAIHFFLTYTIAAWVYPLGYGYDPFIHRATEQHILIHGFALPKTPLYLGQYMAIDIIARITHLPVKILDIWFVPFLASFFLPLTTFLGLRYGLKLNRNQASVGVIMLGLYPLQTMFATTPHNLANVLLLGIVFLALLLPYSPVTARSLILLSIVAVLVHPLSGIFAALFVITMLVLQTKSWQTLTKNLRLKIAVAVLLSMAVIIPILFALYGLRSGLPIPSLVAIRNHLGEFIQLFHEPYYFSTKAVPWLYHLIYSYRLLLPPSLVLLATIVGLKLKQNCWRPFFIFPLIILSNIFFLSTWISIPQLHLYEQRQYAERLLHILMYFILPFAILAIVMTIKKIVTPWRQSLCFGLLATALSISVYLTYPQDNPKVHFPGFNVTAVDIAAAERIHDQTPTAVQYIVLSNILTAAASVEKYGFLTYYSTPEGKMFYYPIPSGSPLTKHFNDLLYQGQKRRTVDEALQLTGADRAYFLVHSYWAKAPEIIRGAKATADRAEEMVVGNTAIWIFTYDRRDTAR